jgi:Flp pilus assembly protein TadD
VGGCVALYQGALFYGESHLRKREYLKAVSHFRRAAELAPDAEARGLARGLVHLAAAGQKALTGDPRGARRQLAHARRRLAPYLPESHRLDLAALLATIEATVGGD